MRKLDITMEERINLACKKVLSRIPEHLHCEDLYQDIACIYLDIHSKHPDYKHAVICNKIYACYINRLIIKYSNDECNYIILPLYNNIENEDDMMFMITDIFGIIRNFVTEREFDIICERFIDNKTLKYIGTMHNIGAERVREIECKAIRKMRNPECKKLIQDFYR